MDKNGLVEQNIYFKALQSAYNVIFLVDHKRDLVECIYGKDSSDLGALYDVHMTIESGINFWVKNYVVPEDKDTVLKYFQAIAGKSKILDERPLQTEFRILWNDDKVCSFISVCIKLDEESSLLCLRDTEKIKYSSIQAREIRFVHHAESIMEEYYKQKFHVLGAMVYEKISDDFFKPIFISKTILDYFGVRKDQFLHYQEEGIHLSDVKYHASKGNFFEIDKLLGGNDCSFNEIKNNKKINLTCSCIYSNVYKILVSYGDIPSVASAVPQRGVFARCFGYFDVFVDGKPVIFSSAKEKELLAILVDRHGGTVNSGEAIKLLWEDEVADEKLKTRYRKLAMELKRTLEKYGIENILINKNGVRSMDVSAFTCDYYELLAGNQEYVKSFHNSYMSDYSWSERTLGTLWDYS